MTKRKWNELGSDSALDVNLYIVHCKGEREHLGGGHCDEEADNIINRDVRFSALLYRTEAIALLAHLAAQIAEAREDDDTVTFQIVGQSTVMPINKTELRRHLRTGFKPSDK